MKRFRGGLVFKARRLSDHSALGSRGIEKTKETPEFTISHIKIEELQRQVQELRGEADPEADPWRKPARGSHTFALIP